MAVERWKSLDDKQRERLLTAESWKSLDDKQRERLSHALKALHYHIYHERESGEIGGVAIVQKDLGRSEEWSPEMKPIFKEWCRDDGWHRVSFADRTDGTLTIRLEQ